MIAFVMGALCGGGCVWGWVGWQAQRSALNARLDEQLAQAQIRSIHLNSLRLMGEAARRAASSDVEQR